MIHRSLECLNIASRYSRINAKTWESKVRDFFILATGNQAPLSSIPFSSSLCLDRFNDFFSRYISLIGFGVNQEQ
jgi:hypothetical protein